MQGRLHPAPLRPGASSSSPGRAPTSPGMTVEEVFQLRPEA